VDHKRAGAELPHGRVCRDCLASSDVLHLLDLPPLEHDTADFVAAGERDTIKRPIMGRVDRAGSLIVADADASWAEFAKLRSEYGGPLNALARYLDVPPAQWVGDRSYVLH